MQIGRRRMVRLLAAVPRWYGLAVLWSAAALPAQLTWVRAGTPPPERHVAPPPFPLAYPFKPERAFFDDSRGRANCLFVNIGNVAWPTYANSVEFDGETWTTAATQSYAILTDSPIGADPRGAGMQVHFGGMHSFFVFGDTNIWNPVARSWSIVNPATRPAARVSHSLALLPGVGTVMFGGDTTVPVIGHELDDTWIWDGSDWREVQTSPRPSPRTAAAMAFDPATGELLLFGGGGLTDTWSFNGARWLQRQPPNSPPPGSVQAITDPVRGHVVLFGGTIGWGNPFRNDTWTWNGTDWSLRAPAHSPPPRTEAQLVWDTVWQRVLMLSGWTGGNGLPDTWAWDGSDWTELRNTDRPTTVVPWARSFATLTQDAQGRTVLFGGQVRQGIQEIPLTDTWEGADRTWQRRTPANSPPPSFANAGTVLRSTGAVSWFPGVGQFGGAVNQLWTWTGSNWTGVPLQTASLTPLHQVAGSLQSSQLGWVLVRLVTTGPAPFLSQTLQLVVPGTGIVQPMFPAGGPAPRTGSAMTQATSATVHGNKVWLFGGGGSAPYFNDVWELADTGSGGNLAWTQRWPAAWSPVPPGRAHAAFAYDELRNRLVVVGGHNGTSLGDTWTFDLGSSMWTQIAGTGPSPRSGAAAAFDLGLGRVVLAGGQDGATRFDDLWEFDGTSWSQRPTPGRPAPRTNLALAHDRVRDRSWLFGGHDSTGAFGDLWSYDGATWTPRVGTAPFGLPPRRYAHAMCFDEAHDTLVVFGGTVGGGIGMNDVWRYDANGQWTPGSPGPGARYNAAMTYAVLQGIPSGVLFGGSGQGGSLADGWRYDVGTGSWQPIAAGPPARENHAMCWDRHRNVVVLFGGRGQTGAFLDDTWELHLGNGTWSPRTPVTRPPARWNHAMAFDGSRGRTVVIGGNTAAGPRNDVWEWDGSSWLERVPETQGPPPHEDGAMCYDARRGRLMLFGGWDGGAVRGELWELHARIDVAGKGNLTNPESLHFHSQPVIGRPLRLGFDSPQGVGFVTLGFGPVQHSQGALPVPPMCEPSDIYASLVAFLVSGNLQPNVAWTAPNSPLLQGVTLVFQAFALQGAGCFRATDALHVRF